jgi:FlaA1/EpsC-like NDP-sugar epimerase
MLIPEAVELVLQAAVLARNRETLVLDMGEQLRVLDVARNLIRLSGFVPDEEIPITFTGLRPGEKLTEELVGEGETLEPAGISKIFRVRWSSASDAPRLADQVNALVSVAMQGRSEDTVAHLRRIVPTFNPAASPVDTSIGALVVSPTRRQPARPLKVLPAASLRRA